MTMSWVSLLCDLITILPFIGWGVMSIFAIPSYAASGWLAPVVIAGSTLSTAPAVSYWSNKKCDKRHSNEAESEWQ